MFDLVTWSIPLGRWLGTPVRLHASFFVFAGLMLAQAAFGAAPLQGVLEAGAVLGLVALAVVLRETGQLILLARLGHPGVVMRLWPLGNFVGPGNVLASRSLESAVVAASGLVTNLALVLGVSLGLATIGAHIEFNPFGGVAGGAPVLAGGRVAAAFSALWWLGWFGWINWVLFIANLIPALPFDMGRIVRGCWVGGNRESEFFPYLARVFAVLMGLVGITRLYSARPGGYLLVGLALLIEWLVRLEARQLEETGYLEEGAFGYDFSQGYTSLEAGPSVVRPKKQGTLKQWRERRSEARRQRRLAQEVAEGSRLDEILEKLHREGSENLSPEEQRFLARVSTKLRNRRPKAKPEDRAR